MPSELELKLAATPEKLLDIKNLKLAGVESQTPWETRHLDNTYFDSKSFKLRELGIGMRIREVDGKLVQTVKSAGKAIGGLHQRNEDNVDLTENKLDTGLINDPYLQILVEEAQEEDGEFSACFKTNFDRTQSLLNFSDGTIIELALDSGTISVGEKSLPICEIELELIEGSAEYVFALGRYLIKELDLTLFNASKARRGYSLCEKASLDYLRLEVTELSPGIEAEMAFEKICFSAFKHWQHYEMFLNQQSAHSAVLEMYRALIFLQHMYIVFAGLIPRQATNDLKNSWDWLAEAMRPIVDAAKHKRYLSKYLEEKADWDLVEEQQKKIQSEVEEKIQEFKELLATQRYNLMMLNMSQWLYSKEWRNFMQEKQQQNLSTPIVDYARKQFDHMSSELKRELGPKIDLEPQDYFKTIAKIRRALDTGLFFGGLFDTQKRLAYRKPWSDILDAIRDLQLSAYIFELLSETHSQDETKQWLQARNKPVLARIINLRKTIFKSSPYWL